MIYARQEHEVDFRPGGGEPRQFDEIEGLLYLHRRAVMPGTTGIINIPSGGSFVRWEARSGTVRIGNNHTTVGTHQYVIITIPGEAAGRLPTAAGSTLDVTIHAMIAERPKMVPELPQGAIGIPYPGGIELDYDPIVIGQGPVGSSPVWDATGLPPGIRINTVTAFIRGEPEYPDPQPEPPITFPHTFPVTIGLTLPGSMRITENFTITINPNPGVLLGDVNGDDRVDLSDLVLLSRFLKGDNILSDLKPPFVMNDFYLAADITGKNRNNTGAPLPPNQSDLIALAEYFRRPDVILGG